MVNEVQSHPLDEACTVNELSSNYSSRNKNSKGNYNGKPWHQKPTASHGRTETTGHGKIKIKGHGKTIIKTKVINPATLAYTLSQDQKFFAPVDCDENTFQTICTLVKAQIDRAKQSSGNSKEINEISKDTLVNLLNISDETYDAAQAARPAGSKR